MTQAINPMEAAYSGIPLQIKPNPYDIFCRSSWCEKIKLLTGSIAVVLLLIVIFIGIINEYCTLKIHPAGNFVILFFSLLLLAYVEALHYGVVAIEKWDMSIYAERFPRAVKCHSLVDTPEKVKKFLVGRQFFVIFVVFLIAQITTFESMPEDFAGMPKVLNLILLQTGLPGVALTLTFGQLVSQIYVEEFTLQFLNLIGCEFVIRLSLFAEFIGICNFSWLLFNNSSKICCSKVRKIQKSLDSAKSTDTLQVEPTSPTERIRGPDYDNGIPEKSFSVWELFKNTWSSAVTIGSIIIVCYGIGMGGYTLPVNIPGAIIIGIILLVVLFYLEGLMIAIVGTQYWDPEVFRNVYPRAYKLHRVMNQPENVKRFIIGRQFFCVYTNFILAQLCHYKHLHVDGIPLGLEWLFFKSGFPGVFIILAFSQLVPELLAAEYPLRFMNLPGSYMIAMISLFFDSWGVGHCGWTIYYTTRSIICKSQMDGDRVDSHTKPVIVKVQSAEVLAQTANV